MTDSLKSALGMLTRFSLPTARNAADSHDVLSCLPLIGCAEGLCFWLLTVLVMWLVEGLVGGIVCAVGVLWLGYYLTEGRKVKGFIWFLETRRHLPESGVDAYLQISFFQGTMLLKAACIAVLSAAGAGVWLVVPPLLSAAALAELLLDHRTTEEEEQVSVFRQSRHWLIALAVCVLVSGVVGRLASGLSIAVIAWLLVPALARLLQRSDGTPLPESGRRAIMEIIELAVLILGVLYFSGRQ